MHFLFKISSIGIYISSLRSYSFWKAAENSSFWTFFNSSVMFLGSQQHPQSGFLWTSFSTWGTESSLAEINLESTGGDKGLQHFWGSKINKNLQLCGRVYYRATRKNLETRTQLGEPAECASGGDPLLLYTILHLLFFPSGTNLRVKYLQLIVHVISMPVFL